MKKLLLILLCLPFIGLASFPIANERTEIINQAYLIPWYNTWWAILLQVIIFPIGCVRLLYWELKKAKKIDWIIAGVVLVIFMIIWLNSSKYLVQ